MAVQVVSQVVFDIARDADHDSAHQKEERRLKERGAEDHQRVPREAAGKVTGPQSIDRVFEHPWRNDRHGVGGHNAEDADDHARLIFLQVGPQGL